MGLTIRVYMLRVKVKDVAILVVDLL